ncbi:hypothetical protein [Actinomadura sediminis]|uniref:Uncharacterized protein n=1 Tax=Actinomadura sediminis TaxID=1038904 RepID=A0ABW3EPP3_9ACTN
MLTQTGAVRAWWSLAMVLVAAVLVAGVNVWYTAHAQRESDQRWCELMAALDEPAAPPGTVRGAQIQREVRQLRADLGCGDR